MNDAIERFLTAKMAENVSPNTIRAYRSDLEQLAAFMGPDAQPAKLTRTIARGFVALHTGVSTSTLRRKFSCVKSFASWLAGEGMIPNDAAESIESLKGPKIPEELPDIPNIEEMAILLDGEFRTAFPERDRLILELLYGNGLRVSEVANIQLADLLPERDAILIHGKGRKQRLAPLNPHSRHALEEYLKVRTAKLERLRLRTNALLFGVRNCGEGESISVRNISRMLREIAKARGLRAMHPHLLRHAFATHMLDNGAPLDIIGDLLGHSNLETTARYTQVSTSLMMSAYKGAHPHAKEKPL